MAPLQESYSEACVRGAVIVWYYRSVYLKRQHVGNVFRFAMMLKSFIRVILILLCMAFHSLSYLKCKCH